MFGDKMDGILLINKTTGMTSHDVVMKIRGHMEQNGLFVFIQSLDDISQLKVE